MRLLCVLFTSLCVCSAGYGQQPIERTTVVEKFAPPVQQAPPTVRKMVTTTYTEVPVYRDVPVVMYRAVPVFSAPVYAYAPVAVPVASYRSGLFGRRQTVIYSNGTVQSYRR